MSCESAQRSKLQMRVTGTLRGAGRWSVPGSRARRRRTDHFENFPLGLGMNREAMLASICNGAEGLAVICLRRSLLRANTSASHQDHQGCTDASPECPQRTHTDAPSETQRPAPQAKQQARVSSVRG